MRALETNCREHGVTFFDPSPGHQGMVKAENSAAGTTTAAIHGMATALAATEAKGRSWNSTPPSTIMASDRRVCRPSQAPSPALWPMRPRAAARITATARKESQKPGPSAARG